ncbi:MAG: alternative ribosome rescue aminoacyl-tRNA hydrolase ArfB [Bacteroidota bacterium]
MNWQTLQEELTFRTSRSSGAGGQHVNKTESKVEIIFNLKESQAFSRGEKLQLKHHLGRRLSPSGIITVVDQSSRSQHANRKSALLRLRRLLEGSNRPIPRPHRGKAFVANKRKRLENKKHRSDLKADRRKKWL